MPNPALYQPDPPTEELVVEIDVPPGQVADVRLDVYLTHKLENATRAKVQRGIREGRVVVNGKVQTRPGVLVQPRWRIVCRLPRPRPLELVPEALPLEIVYEDADLLVVNKAAGMVVHPAYGHPRGTLVNALLHHVGAGPLTLDAYDEDGPENDGPDEEDDPDEDGPLDDRLAPFGLSTAQAGPRFPSDPTIRPGLVHRLDKDTTGLLVVAKHDVAHAHLARQFAERTIRRRYLALTWGVPEPPSGRIETHLGRDPKDRKRVTVLPAPQGKHAVTHYQVVEAFAYAALVAFRLETGRTHQIRVHALHLGHPLLGDVSYGGDRIRSGPDSQRRRAFYHGLFETLPRQALHAQTLGFTHPTTGAAMDFEAPLPTDFRTVLERVRAVEGGAV